MKLKDKVCLVTGSTSGIGKETVIGLAKEGARLVLPVRNIAKGESLRKEVLSMTGNSHIELMSCDLASFDSVRSFAKAFLDKYDRLDLLINNAGIWETKRKKSVDGIELTFAVNHLAPFLLTHLLTDRLISSAPSRVINVSSEAHRYGKMRFDDLERNNKWSLFGPYAQSKLANILFTKELARKLNGAGVTVNCLHPGVVSTHLFDAFPKVFASVSSLFMITPEQGAKTTLHLATSSEVSEISAEYFSKSKIKRTAPQAQDAEAARKLWQVSMEYVKKAKSSVRSDKPLFITAPV
jgi:NAD(P)-dependent dehydrogenase (short-subunit alcohol dehydrogenase family)